MAGKSKRAALLLTVPELQSIQRIANSRTQRLRKVRRAQILFRYQAGQAISQIAEAVAVCRDTVYDCIDKALAMEIDAYYPPQATLRLLLDNHSAHISKETRACLATGPNRFVYVHTPKHGSWLNLVETLFGKMSCTFLKAIRVQSWEEFRQRILQGIAEINAAPVVHRWKKFDLLSPS